MVNRGVGNAARSSVLSISILQQAKRLLRQKRIMAAAALKKKDSLKRPTAVGGIIVTVRSDGNKPVVKKLKLTPPLWPTTNAVRLSKECCRRICLYNLF